MDYRDYRGKRASSTALRRRNYPWITTRGFHLDYFDYLVHATLTHYVSVATIRSCCLDKRAIQWWFDCLPAITPGPTDFDASPICKNLRLLGPVAWTNERRNGNSIIRQREMTSTLCQISKNLRLFGPIAWTQWWFDYSWNEWNFDASPNLQKLATIRSRWTNNGRFKRFDASPNFQKLLGPVGL